MVLNVGQQIGSYCIVAEIAKGTHADVYKASHSILTNRLVALKILHTAYLNSKDGYELFVQEARILEQIKHRYIVAILDVNTHEGFPYIVKEFAPHGSLRDLLRRQHAHPLSLEQSLAILRQIGEALQSVHQHKIVHCDLKPENILFNANYDALLTDFDIARMLESMNVPVAGIGGTPSYMSPEQFQGNVRTESDQYSLGCIAYELMTAHRPFAGKDFETLKYDHLTTLPIPLTHYNPALPPHIEQAILKAMEKKYTQRHHDVAAFIEALDAAPHIADPVQLPYTLQNSQRLILKDMTHNKVNPDEIYYEATVVNTNEVAEPVLPAVKRRKVSVTKESATVKRATGKSVTKVTRATSKETSSTKVSSARRSTKDEHNEKKTALPLKKDGTTSARPISHTRPPTSKSVVTRSTDGDNVVPQKLIPAKPPIAKKANSANIIKDEAKLPKKQATPKSTKSVNQVERESNSLTVSKENALKKLIEDGSRAHAVVKPVSTNNEVAAHKRPAKPKHG